MMYKDIIIGGDLNLPGVDWSAAHPDGGEKQRLVNQLINLGGFTQVIDLPTRLNNILDVFLVRPSELYDSFDLFPGLSDYLCVTLNINFSTFNVIESIIFDITGKQVLSSNNEALIDVSKLNSGLYFIKIKTDQGEFSRKFIKE